MIIALTSTTYASAVPVVFEGAMSYQGIKLSQSSFDEWQSDVIFRYGWGKVILTEDITFDHTIILEDGSDGFYFDCDGHKITGTDATNAFETYDKTSLVNCVIEGRKNGVVLHDDSEAEHITAKDNKEYGLYLYDNSEVTDSSSNGNNRGYFLRDNAHIEGSTASGNKDDGFGFTDYSSGTDLVSTDNAINGFRLFKNSRGKLLTAERNSYNGIQLGDDAEVYYSDSNKNNFGFYAYGNSKIIQSDAYHNKRGFYLIGNAYGDHITAKYNGLGSEDYGVFMREYATAYEVQSDSNFKGIYAEGYAGLKSFSRACFNLEYDIKNSADQYLSGEFQGTKIIGRIDRSAFTQDPCMKMYETNPPYFD